MWQEVSKNPVSIIKCEELQMSVALIYQRWYLHLLKVNKFQKQIILLSMLPPKINKTSILG